MTPVALSRPTPLFFFFFVLVQFCSLSKTVALSIGDPAQGVAFDIDVDTGFSRVIVDGEEWLNVGNELHIPGWSKDMKLTSHEETRDNDDALMGPYTNVSLTWTGGSTTKSSEQVVTTSFLFYSNLNILAWQQYWPFGYQKTTTSEAPNIIAGFPSIHTELQTENIRYVSWGDCMVSQVHSGMWSPKDALAFNGDTHGQPIVWHKNKSAIVVSSMDNFFVSGCSIDETNTTIDCGLRTTLNEIPPNFNHTTFLVYGNKGIQTTLMKWGDILLRKGDKKRTNPYNDFTLAHLGYWTDNGAYYYTGAHTNYSNPQEALIAYHDYAQKQNIPIRYMQWDDWWMQSKGDVPGITSWTPKPSVFPSGFTNFYQPHLALAMYAPEYSSENDWMDQYKWKIDPNGAKTAIPLDAQFYNDMFYNGTKIGMKSFEQDFLCKYGIGGTGLTNTDVSSGATWLMNMNQAAKSHGIKLQYCMMNAYHAMFSTTASEMTNGRATGDNTRNYKSIVSMGQTGLLFHALGFTASRDNVWTTGPETEQPHCGNWHYCKNPNPTLDNAVAVLSNGPYGIADAVGFTNRTLVMQSCRSDGVMLRPSTPIVSLDFCFTDHDDTAPLVWAAHDDYQVYYNDHDQGLKWSYIVGIDLLDDVELTPRRLEQPTESIVMVAYEVEVGQIPSNVIFFDESTPLVLPKAPSINNVRPTHVHWVAAPILGNGMVLLGEVLKWTTMSKRRISTMAMNNQILNLLLVGAPGEQITFAYLNTNHSADVHTVECQFGEKHHSKDEHGNLDSLLRMSCYPQSGCFCVQDASLRGATERPYEQSVA